MEEEITLNLRDLYTIIRKRLGLIITITLLCTLGGGLFSVFVVKPTYQTDMSIVIGKVDPAVSSNLNDITIYQQLVKTYAAIAASNSVALAASAKLGNIDAKTLISSITITSQTDTQIIGIKALAGSPKNAYDNINAVTDAFIAEAMKIYPSGSLAVMDEAVLPSTPIKPNKKLNIAIAFFIGLIVSIGLVFILEYLDTTIKTEEDVKRYLGLPVIATIPKYKSR